MSVPVFQLVCAHFAFLREANTDDTILVHDGIELCGLAPLISPALDQMIAHRRTHDNDELRNIRGSSDAPCRLGFEAERVGKA